MLKKGDNIEHVSDGYSGSIIYIFKDESAIIEIPNTPQNIKIWGTALPYKIHLHLKDFKLILKR